VDFDYDEEQLALRESVHALLDKSYGDFGRQRDTVEADPGFDEGLWERLAGLGVLGLPFAEEHGGMGAGPVEVALVAEELGRVLAPEPFLLGVMLAGGLIESAGDEDQRRRILAEVSEGALLPTLAHLEPGSRWSPSAGAVTAARDGDAWRLGGVKEPVPHGIRADLLVVSAALPDGSTGLFLVEPGADGLVRDGYATHDGGRAARVTLDHTPGVPLGEPGADRTADVVRALDVTRIAACHQAVGAMSVALSSTTDYLRTRKQFGVPLSSFQALTFRAADMYVSLEMARSVAMWATLVLLDCADDAPVGEAAARASLQVSRAGRHLGQEAIQMHGGIGMTAEYAVGHYLSHLTALEHWLGDGRHHLAGLAERIGDHADVDPIP
jgi:alkylation response protein AidB-like acyl-CoA dehydrogenase